MKILSGIDKLQLNKKSVVCFGKFDGFHLGHAVLISQAVDIARREKLNVVVFVIDTGRKPIITEEYRDLLFEEAGIDIVVKCKLEDIKKMRAEDFAVNILFEQANASYIVVGPDVSFGAERRGDAKMLFAYGQHFGVYTIVVPKKLYMNRPISSSRIRSLIEDDEIRAAEALLGHMIR